MSRDHSHIYGANPITRDLPEAKLWSQLAVARHQRRDALSAAVREVWKHKLPDEVHNAHVEAIHVVERLDDGKVDDAFADYLEAAAIQRLGRPWHEIAAEEQMQSLKKTGAT